MTTTAHENVSGDQAQPKHESRKPDPLALLDLDCSVKSCNHRCPSLPLSHSANNFGSDCQRSLRHLERRQCKRTQGHSITKDRRRHHGTPSGRGPRAAAAQGEDVRSLGPMWARRVLPTARAPASAHSPFPRASTPLRRNKARGSCFDACA